MKRILYLSALPVFGGLAVLFALLYLFGGGDSQRNQVFVSRDRQWILSGKQHLFDATERTFGLDGLFGFAEGIDKWPPAGGPRSGYKPLFVGPDVKTAISDDEFVIGVVNGHVATAYPLRVAAFHQVIIDESQERPVTVYFGNCSRTAAAYSSYSDGRPTYLQCTGFLYRNADLLFDYQTESIFQPVTGMFAAGQRLGQRLRLLPSAVMPLGQWKAIRPDTRVMIEKTGIMGMTYPRVDVLSGPLKFKTAHVRLPGAPFRETEPVVALFDGWDCVYVPFAAGKRTGRAEAAFSLNGKLYTVHFTPDYGSAWITDESGALVPQIRSVCAVVMSISPGFTPADLR